jgi:hypothetical protein
MANRSLEAKDFGAHGRIPRSSRDGRRNGRKKYSVVITLAAWLTASDSGGFRLLIPVAPALAVPFRFARRCRPVSLLGLPSPPFPRRFSTDLTAIPLPCLPRVKTLPAPFEQTTPRPGNSPPACRTLPPASPLIVGMACRTLGTAHGGDHSQKLLALEGNPLLSRAQTSGARQHQHSDQNVILFWRVLSAVPSTGTATRSHRRTY